MTLASSEYIGKPVVLLYALCELFSNWPKISTPKQKINVDNKANFRYPDDYSFRLMEASICWTAAETGTQLAIFAWYALKKQYLIFLSFSEVSPRPYDTGMVTMITQPQNEFEW